MQNLYTNSTSRRDFLDNYFLGMQATPCYVFAAVAFYTHHEIVTRLLSVGCRVDLIVRLGYPTSPKALGELMGREGVRLRYVTDTTFHPKLYIFDEVGAVVGSSNLTYAAMRINQEVNVVVPVADERYGELRTLFQEYWNDARPMDDAALANYRRAYDQHAAQFAKISTDMENRVHKDIGRVTINNIERGLPKPGKAEIMLDGYRQTYQEFEDCFRTVLSVYQGLGQRRYTEQQLPLRLEIDQYLSYVRDAKTVGDSYLQESRQTGAALEQRIRDTALEFMAADRKYSDNTVVKQSYPTINRILGVEGQHRDRDIRRPHRGIVVRSLVPRTASLLPRWARNACGSVQSGEQLGPGEVLVDIPAARRRGLRDADGQLHLQPRLPTEPVWPKCNAGDAWLGQPRGHPDLQQPHVAGNVLAGAVGETRRRLNSAAMTTGQTSNGLEVPPVKDGYPQR